MMTEAGTLTEDRPIPPLPETFPARHRHQTPPREYFCRTCWGWYVSECPEHGRADPRGARADPTVEQERRDRLAAQAATVEGQNDAAALHEGPLVYALLKWARQTYDGVSEADLAEWREEYRRRRQEHSTSRPRVAQEDSATALGALLRERMEAEQTADLALAISGTTSSSTTITEDLAAPVAKTAASAPAKPRHPKDEPRKP